MLPAPRKKDAMPKPLFVRHHWWGKSTAFYNSQEHITGEITSDSHTHTYIHSRIHTRIHKYTHTYIQSYTHSCIYIFTCFVQQSIPWVPRLPLDVTSPSRLSRRCRRRRTLSQPRPRPRAIWCSKWIRRRRSTPKQVWGWGRWEQLSWHLDYLGLENMEVYQGKFLNNDFFGSPHGLWHWWSLGFTRVFGTVDLSN